MGVKEIYQNIEDKFFDAMDWLSDKGIPVYAPIDFLEGKGIPAFPATILLLLVIIGLLSFFLVPGLFVPQSSLKLKVVDEQGKAIQGILVQLTVEGKTLEKNTDAVGIAEFAVPLNVETQVRISQTGYQVLQQKVLADKPVKEQTLSLKLSPGKTITKTIQLVSATGNEAITTPVSVSFSCTGLTDYSFDATSVNGIVTVEAPEACKELIINDLSQGFTPVTEQLVISLAEASPSIELIIADEGIGTLIVYVFDSAGNGLAEKEVSLMKAIGLKLAGPKTTDASGTVKFENVPVGQYYLLVYDTAGVYAELDSRDVTGIGITEVSKGTTSTVQLNLTNAALGKILLALVDDKTNTAIPGAVAKLYKNENQLITEQVSDSKGKISFNVSEDIPYSVVVDQKDYIKKTVTNVKMSATEQSILLTQATPENSQTAMIVVVDEEGKPVENATVYLADAGTKAVVTVSKTTNAAGNAEFTGIPEGSYYAQAFKGEQGFQGKSDSKLVVKKQANEFNIVMNIGKGNIALEVVDDLGNAVAGATVKLVDIVSGSVVAEGITDALGKYNQLVRADKIVYALVQKQGFAKYFSKSVDVEAEITKNLSAKLEKDVVSLSLELEGTYIQEGKELKKVEALAPNTEYIVRFLLKVPKGTFAEAGVHLRTGEAELMAKDPVFIKGIETSNAKAMKATSLSPPLGYASDAANVTTGNAKWVNAVFNNPESGVYEIVLRMQVLEPTTAVKLNYRAWLKSISWIRFPVDDVLGLAESSPGKQALYAATKERVYASGIGSYCDGTFCSGYSITDLAEELKTAIVQSYSAQTATNYRLDFELVSQSATPFSNSDLIIKTSSSNVILQNYEAEAPGARKITGVVNGTETKPGIKIGDIAKDDTIKGFINFKTQGSGTTALALEIRSANKTVSKKIINVEIASPLRLGLQVLPGTIVPFIENNLVIRVVDLDSNAPLENALVTGRINATVISQGKTSLEGLYAFTLPSQSTGTKLVLSAEKAGYAPSSKAMEISEKLFDATPTALEQTLPITADDVEDQVTLVNVTSMPLNLKSLVVSNDFAGLVTFYWKENYTGLVQPSEVKQIVLRTGITDEGRRVLEQTSLNGKISLTISSTELGKTWIQEIPLTVRIALGGQVANLSCLVIEPNEWALFSDGSTVTKEFELRNECAVDAKQVALRELMAKVDGGTELGEFILSSDIEGARLNVGLKTAFNSIAPSIAQGASNSLSLTFKPKEVKTAKKNVKISFQAINPAQAGDETLKAGIASSININSLLACVSVKPQTPIQLYDNYSSLYGSQNASGYLPTQPFNPYPQQSTWNQYSQGFNPQYYYGPGTGYQTPYTSQNNYPQTGYGGATNSWNYLGGFQGTYSQGKVTVTNNCSAGITAFVQPTAGIFASEQQLSIAPGQSASTQVFSQGITGMNFKVDVTAKLTESLGAEVLIGSIPVQVLRDFYQDERECFTVNPTTLNFSALVPDKELKIYNKCYPSIRLSEGDVKLEQESITLPGQVKVPEGMPYVEQISTYDDRDFKDGQKIQLMRILLRKNPKIIRQPEPTTDDSEWYGTLEAARVGIARLDWSVSVFMNLRIGYTDRLGQKTTYTQRITVRDAFNWFEGVDLVNSLTDQTYGDPKVYAAQKGKSCINSKEFDLDGKMTELRGVLGFSGFKRGDGQFISNKTSWRINPFEGMQDSKKCGTLMKLKNLKIEDLSEPKEKEGIKTEFTLVDNGKFISVTVELPATGMTKDVGLRYLLVADIESGWPGQKEEKWTASIPFKISILKDKAPDFIGQELVPDRKLCKALGEDWWTGTGALSLYGLDRINYNWKYTELPFNYCDAAFDRHIYCDATQFTIELTKKIKVINDLLTEMQAKGIALTTLKDLPKSLKKTIEVDSKKYYYWSDESGLVNSPSALKMTAEETTIYDKAEKADDVFVYVLQNKEVFKNVFNKNDVIVQFLNEYITDASKGKLSKAKLIANKFYVLSGNDFIDLIESNKADGDFTQQIIRGGSTFIKAISIDRELSTAEKTAVASYASDALEGFGWANFKVSDLENAGLKGYADFSSKYLIFESSLMSDALTDSFFNDLSNTALIFNLFPSHAKTSVDKYFKAKGLNFNLSAGNYKVTIDGTIKAGALDAITLSIEKLKEAELNPFYSLPFNDEIGIEARNGYGVTNIPYSTTIAKGTGLKNVSFVLNESKTSDNKIILKIKQSETLTGQKTITLMTYPETKDWTLKKIIEEGIPKGNICINRKAVSAGTFNETEFNLKQNIGEKK